MERLRGRDTSADVWAARHSAGTAEAQLGHVTAYREAGARHSMVALPDIHLEGSIETFGAVIANLTLT